MKRQGFILGYFKGRPIYATGREHIGVIGPTGSWKSTALMIPNALTSPNNLFVLDIAHELHNTTSGFRKHCGSDVYKVAFGEPAGISHSWNPFSAISDNPLHRVDQLQALSHMWIAKGADENPIWPGGARAMFVGLALLIWELHGKERLTPGELYRIAHAPVPLQTFIMLVLWKHGASFDPAVSRLLGSIIHKPSKTIGSIVETLSAQLKMFESPLLDAATNRSDFSFADFRKRPMDIYLCVTDNQMNRLNHLLTIFIDQFLSAMLASVPGEDEPYWVDTLLDETDSLGKMDRLSGSITKLRKHNVMMCMILQSQQQLAATYGRERADVMFGNAKNRIYYTTNEQGLRENLSRDLGNTTVKVHTHSWSSWRKTKSEQYEKVPLMSADQLRLMPREDQIVMIEGVPAIYCKGGRRPFFHNRELKARAKYGAAPVPHLTPQSEPEIYEEMYKRLADEYKEEQERMEKEKRTKVAEDRAATMLRRPTKKKRTTKKKAASNRQAAEALVDNFFD